DCAGCHMPKRSLTLISHSVLTDHRIVAREGEPYPDVAFHQTTPELPGLVHVNRIPGAADAIPPLTLLRAYGELLASHPEYRQPYLGVLDQLGRAEPDNPLVLSALAFRRMSEGTPEGREAAIRYGSRAIQLGSSSSADYENLGSLLADSGRTSEAITILELGIRLDPYDERLYKRLAQLNISVHQYARALEAMKKDLALFPQDDFMRSLVKKAGQAEPPSGGLPGNP
ncbi:MAG TPA: tetratricopeptide repeat protein, partial [Blastocatellia bacterium]|nr:tetratricopeptide repeat protein [Blastocatellia bacterium]